MIYIISVSADNKLLDISSISLREQIEMILWQFSGEFYDIFISLNEKNKVLDLNNAFNDYEHYFIELICKGCVDLGQNLPFIHNNRPKMKSIDPNININQMSIKQIVKSLGLESVFIMKGINVEIILEKYFHDKDNKITGIDLSNYFMAIDSFARNYILAKLLNFGFFFNRLYFDKFSIQKEEYIVLYVFNDVIYCYNSIKESKKIIQEIKETVRGRLLHNSKYLTPKSIYRIFDLRRTNTEK